MSWHYFSRILESLTLLDYAVIIFNVLLIIYADPLLKRFSPATVPQHTHRMRVYMLRGLNFIILLVYGYFILLGLYTTTSIAILAINHSLLYRLIRRFILFFVPLGLFVAASFIKNEIDYSNYSGAQEPEEMTTEKMKE